MARELGIPYTDEPPYYFISYSSEDEKKVSEYAKVLSGFNVPLWYDIGIKVGLEWEKEIAEKIHMCQAVIMFISKNILEKDNSYVHKEYTLAKEYSNKKICIVMLDDIDKKSVPFRFRMWWVEIMKLHCINAYTYKSPERCMEKLMESIGFKCNNVNALSEGENYETESKYPIKESILNVQQERINEIKAKKKGIAIGATVGGFLGGPFGAMLGGMIGAATDSARRIHDENLMVQMLEITDNVFEALCVKYRLSDSEQENITEKLKNVITIETIETMSKSDAPEKFSEELLCAVIEKELMKK